MIIRPTWIITYKNVYFFHEITRLEETLSEQVERAVEAVRAEEQQKAERKAQEWEENKQSLNNRYNSLRLLDSSFVHSK